MNDAFAGEGELQGVGQFSPPHEPVSFLKPQTSKEDAFGSVASSAY
jgi:hypothetical protein